MFVIVIEKGVFDKYYYKGLEFMKIFVINVSQYVSQFYFAV